MLSSPFFLLCTVLLHGVTQAFNQTIRIELDPDPATVMEPCTPDFMSQLTTQISFWFTKGVATYKNSSQAALPRLPFKNTVNQGGSETTVRHLKPKEPSLADIAAASRKQGDRELCSWTSCKYCCPAFCSSWCTNGSCGKLCGSSRKLRGGDEEDSRRHLDSTGWWYGDQNLQSGVAAVLQQVAAQWLAINDSTQCMGDPKKLQVKLNYF